MYKNSTITSSDILKMLKKRHAKELFFYELRLSSGFEMEGRVDALALNVSPATGNRCEAYEIKVSRSDFRRDSHKKQRGARLYSDKLWFVAPKGVIPHEEVPDWAGLLEAEWYAPTYGNPFLRFVKSIPAPKRDKESPSWGLVVSLVRNATKQGIE